MPAGERQSTSSATGTARGRRAPTARLEAAVVEHGRVDAADQVAQLDDRLLRLVVGLADQLARARRGCRRVLAARPRSIPSRDEPLLGAVVQVALDAAALGDRAVDRAAMRLLQLLDPRILRRGAEQSLHEHPVEQRERPDDRRQPRA